MQQSYGEVEPYSLGVLLDREGQDLHMELNGPRNETIYCAPEHAYRTAKKLDKAYEGALPESWEVKYILEIDHVFASLRKQYDEMHEFWNSGDIAINPAHNKFVSPIENPGLEVEIGRITDIDPEQFLKIVER